MAAIAVECEDCETVKECAELTEICQCSRCGHWYFKDGEEMHQMSHVAGDGLGMHGGLDE